MPERPFPDLNKPNGCARDLGLMAVAAGSLVAGAVHLLAWAAARRTR